MKKSIKDHNGKKVSYEKPKNGNTKERKGRLKLKRLSIIQVTVI